jgi:adenylate cyclase
MNTGYRLGEWVIRPQHASIERGDEVVHLKPKPMAVLECLRQARGEVVTRDQLFESVWPGGVVSDATLTQCIAELRRAFGDSAQTPRVIKTIPKVGFCLIPPVEEMAAETVQPEDPGNPSKQWLPKKPGTFGAALVIAVLAFGAWWSQHDVAVSEPDSIAQDNGITPSIAVLPFVNMSDEPGNEYFADGLSEELQSLLAKIPQLKVSARTSSFAFRNKDVTVAEIARTLNVAHLLEGSVRKTGNRIRISVQLIEAKSGFELWSESYDRTLDDIFAVQDDVAAAVVDALRISLMNEPPRLRETNAEVYSMYLQALFFLNQSTREGRAKTVEKLQATLAVDPNFAPAVDLLAKTFLFQSNSGERSFDAGFELGRKTALEALAIDTDLAGPRATLAYIESYYDWDWQAAGRSVQQMLELGPENAINTAIAATYYNILGQFELSLELRNQAIQLDPITGDFRVKKVYTLLATGRLDEAERTVQDLLEIHPEYRSAHFLQAKILLISGDDEGALQVLETLPDFGNNDEGLLAMALHGVGRAPESQAIIDSIFPDSKDAAYTGGISYNRALYYAWTGERDLAFTHLEQALEVKHRPLAYVLGEPMLYPLHDDPRWLTLLERIGLLPYWLEVPEQYGGPVR